MTSDLTRTHESAKRLATQAALQGNVKADGCWFLNFDWACEKPVPLYIATPTRLGGRPYEVSFTAPCRKCDKCKQFKQMHWRERIMREAFAHQYSYFVTLTFSPAHLSGLTAEALLYSRQEGMKALEERAYKHVQLFVKRLRKGRKKNSRKKELNSLGRLRQSFNPLVFRYFAVFELGDKTGRPHFHMLVHTNKWIPPEIIETEWRSICEAELVRSYEGCASYASKYLTPSDGFARPRASRNYGSDIFLSSLKEKEKNTPPKRDKQT